MLSPTAPRWLGARLGGTRRASLLLGGWRSDERLLRFLAFGMMFDHDVARRAIESAEAARLAWLEQHGDRDLSNDELARLLAEVVEGALAPYRGSPLSLGLSAGFDSRPLLHTLWKLGRSPILYNFGSVGNIDHDLVGVLARRMGLDIDVVDSNTAEWRLELLEERSRTTADLLISPRVLSAAVMDARHPGRVDVHGFLNGALTGGTRPPSKRLRGDDRMAFAIKNDVFGLQSYLPPQIVARELERSAASASRGISVYRQLDIGYRQAQRIKAGPAEPVPLACPYADERWVGYWLNRPPSELEHQRRWVDFVRSLDAELFFDLQDLHDEGWAFNRTRLRRIYGDSETPGYVDVAAAGLQLPPHPKNHFSLYACFVNNASFRAMIDESVARLRGRRIFAEGFVDFVLRRFIAGEPSGAVMLNGLVSTDIAVEAGRL